MRIQSLKEISLEQIHAAFSHAFADYEIQLSKDELQNMLQRRGFVPDLSFAAFDNDVMVSFTLNGIGEFNGVKTAYDTGTGTVPDYRGKSLATKVFEYSIPFLKAAKIKQYLLEVLQHNTNAVNIYQNIGFMVSREFNYFVKEVDEIALNSNPLNTSVAIQTIELEQCYPLSENFDFHPSWQNSFASIRRQEEKFSCLGAFIYDELVAYCIIEPGSGDITQIVVKPEHRRKGIATLLIKEGLKRIQIKSVKVINTATDCHSINGFLAANNIEVSGKQYEMIKVLDE